MRKKCGRSESEARYKKILLKFFGYPLRNKNGIMAIPEAQNPF